jgi:hypothetical protein
MPYNPRVKLAAWGLPPSAPPVNMWMTLNVCACAGWLVIAASMQSSVMAMSPESKRRFEPRIS